MKYPLKPRRTPKQLVVIAATPRSGSSLLFNALHASGMSSDPIEYFHPANFAWYLTGRSRITRRLKTPAIATAEASTRSVRNALINIADAHTTPDGTLSLKIMWSDYLPVLLGKGVDFSIFEVPVIWVRIRRDDQVSQAVSWARATQTQSWKATTPEDRVPVYDRDEIEYFRSRIGPENAAWDTYLKAQGATPVEVIYEDLDANYEDTVRFVLDSIGAPDAGVGTRQIARQADHINAEWVQRFRSDLGLTAAPD